MKGKRTMKSIKDQSRQGDILIDPAPHPDKLPEPVKPEDGRTIIARGEATGHHHSFASKPNVLLFRHDENALTSYLRIDGVPESLQHQEHNPHVKTARTYEAIQQREWNLGRMRRVVD